MKNKELGLIRGRHPLPVNKYILNDSVNEFTKDALEQKLKK